MSHKVVFTRAWQVFAEDGKCASGIGLIHLTWSQAFAKQAGRQAHVSRDISKTCGCIRAIPDSHRNPKKITSWIWSIKHLGPIVGTE